MKCSAVKRYEVLFSAVQCSVWYYAVQCSAVMVRPVPKYTQQYLWTNEAMIVSINPTYRAGLKYGAFISLGLYYCELQSYM